MRRSGSPPWLTGGYGLLTRATGAEERQAMVRQGERRLPFDSALDVRERATRHFHGQTTAHTDHVMMVLGGAIGVAELAIWLDQPLSETKANEQFQGAVDRGKS